MLLALAISDKDIEQAERLVKWIGFLSEQDGRKLSDESVLVVWSVKSSFLRPTERIDKLMANTFGTVIDLVSPEHEVGWPGAANRMFQTVLEFCEKAGDSVFFLEPDGVPLRMDWLEQIESEYRKAGRPFMGGFVPTAPEHMTGIAVYPPDWRRYAPSLANVPDSAGWDTYCAGEVNPHAHFTPLIQHVFKRHQPGWSIPGLNALDPRAVIFHQDKYGKLISLLDDTMFAGQCSRHPTFGYSLRQPQIPVMTKFYRCANATKPTTVRGGRRFVFDPVEPFGGSIPGVYATENPVEQSLLDDIAMNPTTGVVVISQKEWEQLAKKNWTHPVLATSRPSNPTLPQVPLVPTPSRQVAHVVAEPSFVVGDPTAPPGLSTIKDINEVLKTDHVTPSQPAPPSAKVRRAKPAKAKT